MTSPLITPERAERESLQNALRMAASEIEDQRFSAAMARANLAGLDVALQREHARAVKLEGERDEALRLRDLAQSDAGLLVQDVKRACDERDVARRDLKACTESHQKANRELLALDVAENERDEARSALAGVSLELDRLLSKAVPLTLEAVVRIRSLIPSEEKGAEKT